MNNLNVLVTGGEGQLAKSIKSISKNYPNYNFYFFNKRDFDICIFNQVQEVILENKIDIIINCAAFTAVDRAEVEVENANLINNLCIKNLIDIANKNSISLIHISTDAVFDGKKNIPYKEIDTTNPISEYGKSKLFGENLILKESKKAIILRVSWLYSEYNDNFFLKVIKIANSVKNLNFVIDQISSPTYSIDLAYVIMKIIDEKSIQDGVNIFHYANSGVASKYDFAFEILNLLNIKYNKIEPVLSDYFKTDAKRTNYSVLNSDKIKNTFNIDIPHWKDSLKKCIKNYNANFY